jgi:hypothetical protein
MKPFRRYRDFPSSLLKVTRVRGFISAVFSHSLLECYLDEKKNEIDL